MNTIDPHKPEVVEKLILLIRALPQKSPTSAMYSGALNLMKHLLDEHPQWTEQITEEVLQIMDRVPQERISDFWALLTKYESDLQVKKQMLDRMFQRDDIDSPELWEAVSHLVSFSGGKGLVRKAAEKASSLEDDDLYEMFFESTFENILGQAITLDGEEVENHYQSLDDLLGTADGEIIDQALEIAVKSIYFHEKMAMSLNYDEILSRVERAVNMIIGHGADIEKPTSFIDAREDIDLSLTGPLHLACILHENDEEEKSHGIGIQALLNCGADWNSVLEHRNAPKGAAISLIEKHPAFKRQKLLEIGSSKQEKRKRTSRPGI